MRKALFVAFSCLVLAQGGFSQETEALRIRPSHGRVAGYATRDATVLSMMGWGVGLAAGIATLFALMHNNSSSSH